MFGSKRSHSGIRSQLTPMPGNWYVDKAGALFKVRALVYENGKPEHVIIDYPKGGRIRVALSQWKHFIYQASIASHGQRETTA